MEKTDKKILQTMALMGVAILIGIFVQHAGSENISVEFVNEPETFSETIVHIEEDESDAMIANEETGQTNNAIEIIPKIIIIESDSFGDAFAQAREQLGPNHTFIWNGQPYTTHLADEVPTTPIPVQEPNSDEPTSPGTSLADVAPKDVATFPDGPDFVKAE